MNHAHAQDNDVVSGFVSLVTLQVPFFGQKTTLTTLCVVPCKMGGEGVIAGILRWLQILSETPT